MKKIFCFVLSAEKYNILVPIDEIINASMLDLASKHIYYIFIQKIDINSNAYYYQYTNHV